ncbi:MAG: 16S rRNA (cytosine(967)-C(5))-methyltransferase RsmB, partial [Oscillospiraceae bacterium]|nr:16S rRNA (cytosine(967)-C(5))-methyltransferase RsmB [Oscillospiraceae bacterium]
ARDWPPDTLELRAPGDITRFTAFRRGWFFVQDPAAKLAADLCGAMPGQTILDTCAAPGGKSFALALAMRNVGSVLAFDTEKRVPLIRDGAARLGLTCVSARVGDAAKFDPALAASADIVFVDAPCSGFGVVRKKPEIRYKPPESLAALPETQYAILRAASGCVKPGGTLLYATCTLLDAENGDVTARFRRDCPAFTLAEERTLWPHRDGTDGFYICKMSKTGGYRWTDKTSKP